MAEVLVISFDASVSLMVERARFLSLANDFAQGGKGFFGGRYPRRRHLHGCGFGNYCGNWRPFGARVEAVRARGETGGCVARGSA